ncbi:hypothetical protein F4802DRAFT_561261 [Xylaria palmicola]|nr:hypothetical protein F4802DRAFT_561261 [Xylaria palmicola]
MQASSLASVASVTIVASMAENEESAEVRLKKLHPFFSASTSASASASALQPVPAPVPNTDSKADKAITPPTPDSSCSPASDESRNDPIEHNSHCEHGECKHKRRKTDPPGASETLPRDPRPKRRARVSAGSSITNHFHPDTAKGAGVDVEPGRNEEQVQGTPDDVGDAHLLSTESSEDVESGLHATRGERNWEVFSATCGPESQKLLKLNPATGTIGPPPPPKPSTLTSILKPGKKRGRKRKALVISISYGADSPSREQVGQRINTVLLGTSRIPPRPKDIPPATHPSYGDTVGNKEGVSGSIPLNKGTHQKTITPKTPAHPFFNAKSKAAPSTSDNVVKVKKDKMPPKRQVIFTSTPLSSSRTRPALSDSYPTTPSSTKGGLKVPGAKYPAWPWRDIVHVRDSSGLQFIQNAGHEPIIIGFKRRKAKGQAIHISEHESILHDAASKLRIPQLSDDLKSISDKDFIPIPPSVRVPIKHFESGRKLQQQVFKELRTLRNHDGSLKPHTAICHAYNSIATSLSAFDTCTCESVAWAQKYAPSAAREVLQNGREADLLRDWLQSLKVQAVDTGLSDSAPKAKVAPMKKRRRRKKLEGFVVSSDEEACELEEISDSEPCWLINGGRGDARKTVVRSGDVDRGGRPNSRLANAVLLSGPHGCGKTATVYAIAKELEFEVFEINAGARRSGKDILEKVGDMTRNHLVNHQQKFDTRNDGLAQDDVAKEVNSGKQGMMTSFFRPKATPSTKEAQAVHQTTNAAAPASQEKKPNREQKQSLILLEEVDILYEEDRQFWATVISMIAQSKRPFIMTCNNESVVPLQNLKLHGIFRFSSPPLDSAVDMLLLIAANEGHAIGRRAIEALYESRGHDLRASITELNYWCQLGVGDPRGGFDWFYPRWPKGSDVDEQGQTIRVVSQDTYHAGMGWLNRDLTMTQETLPSIAPDLHREVWDHWGLDVSDHHDFENPSDWAKKATEQACSREARVALLQSIETFMDSVSESDLCGPLTNFSNQITLDTTVPDLHAKLLDDFTVGERVLEATPLCHYSSISQGVATSMRMLSRSKLAGSQSAIEIGCSIERFDEKCVVRHIENQVKMSTRGESSITRKDYSMAFDPIATSERILANGYLDPSVFDREMTPLCLDVAPYVRSIVSYDQQLYDERRARSNFLSEGGKSDKKRMRTTRAALSALEGGPRATTRRERYFEGNVNPYLVLRTGGKCWGGLVHRMGRSGDNDSAVEGNDDMDLDATSDQSWAP